MIAIWAYCKHVDYNTYDEYNVTGTDPQPDTTLMERVCNECGWQEVTRKSGGGVVIGVLEREWPAWIRAQEDQFVEFAREYIPGF
ncbi:MAG: hypothetical protein WC773_04490 [Patescibacteria group bacterium]